LVKADATTTTDVNKSKQRVQKGIMKNRIIHMMETAGFQWLTPAVRLAAGERPREQLIDLFKFIGLPLIGWAGQAFSSYKWQLLGQEIDRQLENDRVFRQELIAEENELRRRLGLPPLSAPATKLPAPYEVAAASTSVILEAERRAAEISAA
jgi:hypothetical protein